MSGDPVARLRAICLALPGAVEAGGVGDPSFKVRGKIFAMQHRWDGRPSMWCKAQPGLQQLLVTGAPERFFRPPYVGQHGWVGAWLEPEPDWQELEGLIEESWLLTAPKKLAAQLGS